MHVAINTWRSEPKELVQGHMLPVISNLTHMTKLPRCILGFVGGCAGAEMRCEGGGMGIGGKALSNRQICKKKNTL